MPIDIVRNRLLLSTFFNIFFNFLLLNFHFSKKNLFYKLFYLLFSSSVFFELFPTFFKPAGHTTLFWPSLIRPKEVGPTCTSLGEAADHLFHDTSYCDSYTSLNSYNWFTLSEHTHVSHYYHSYYSCLLMHSVVKVDVSNQSFLPCSSKPVLCPHQG